jgi:inhibitor of cysteine peptidase
MMRLFSQKEPFATEDGLITPKNKNLYWAFGLVAGSWSICLMISGAVWLINKTQLDDSLEKSAPAISQFGSESEFRSYLRERQDSFSGMMRMGMAEDMATGASPVELNFGAKNEAASRYSESNVQVRGIDEPDIVKTDGQHIFISSEQTYYLMREMPMREPSIGIAPDIGIMPPMEREMKPATDIITALPVNSIKKASSVEANGKLLVTDNRLVVFENQNVSGFDISDTSKPAKKWEYELDSSRQIETARLVGDSIVIVSNVSVYQGSPCPIPLWKGQGADTSIACTDIWRPDLPVTVDGVYTVIKLNPDDGSVTDTISFVGAQGHTVVYVSSNAVYVTFAASLTQSELLAEVLLSPEITLINDETKKRLGNVIALDISQAAKQVEIEQILSGYSNSLSDDERMKWQAEISNQMDDYIDVHKREIEETIITKIDLDTLEIADSGSIPGRLLNQFSLDEYEGNLRVATTVGGSMFGSSQSANDVYVLDGNLGVAGSVLDLGKEERIYAVRFMGDRGFVVTFRETDPLYALDLSDAASPKVTGELKIPGYSSYLHPLKEHLLVGIGKEGSQVKVSLFDVSNPANPTEIDKYTLPDYWTDIMSTHLAFLQDEKHEVFFVPASSGGYIFGYEGNKLELLKTTSGNSIRRALYINDYLYLIGNRDMSVISESDWTTARTFEW